MMDKKIRNDVTKICKMDELPNSWDAKQIKQVLKIESGVWDSENENGYGVLRSTNFDKSGYIDFNDVTYRDIKKDKIEQKKLKNGDILLEISGGGPDQPVGRVVYSDDIENKEEDYLFGNFVKRLRTKNSNYNSYYIFRMLDRLYNIGQTEVLQNQTTGIRNLDYRAYMSLPIPIPPYQEQKKMTSILSSVDKAIEKTDEVIEETKQLKKGLMQELLTKGIGHNEFKEIKIGPKILKIPSQWNLKNIKEIAELSGGYAFKSKKFIEEEPKNGYQVIRMGNIEMCNLNLNKNNVYLEKKKLNENAYKYILNEGDIIITLTGTVSKRDYGEVVLIEEDNQYLLNQRNCRISPNEKIINYYLYNYLQTKVFRDQFFLEGKGGTGNQENISIRDVAKMMVLLPAIEEQKKIVSLLKSVDKKIQKEQEYKKELETLKKGLMQKLLTGEVRVNVDNEEV